MYSVAVASLSDCRHPLDPPVHHPDRGREGNAADPDRRGLGAGADDGHRREAHALLARLRIASKMMHAEPIARPMPIKQSMLLERGADGRSSPQAGHEALGNVVRILPIAW